ncbi:hypothetical protein M0813_15629 [Anaeramoeba flamelloides]|uniref:Uncharacterized protein n=1 Tax=Anaeramoeba flamelloides TaxID=1746091 RepID=A0ABQ8Z1Z7_9EUKA|nr:hypothetical protein M0813_15629 [Anaeramoeba flamelloides]
MDQQDLFTKSMRKRSFSEADSEICPQTTTILTKTANNNPHPFKQRRLAKRQDIGTNTKTQQEITKLESKFDQIFEKHSQLANRVQILISEKEQMKHQLTQLRRLVQQNEMKQRKKVLKEKKLTTNLLRFLIIRGHILPSSQKAKTLFNNLIKNTQTQKNNDRSQTNKKTTVTTCKKILM